MYFCNSVCTCCSSCARRSGNRRLRPLPRQIRTLVRQPAATPSSKTLCTAIACLSMPLTPRQTLRHVLFLYYTISTSIILKIAVQTKGDVRFNISTNCLTISFDANHSSFSLKVRIHLLQMLGHICIATLSFLWTQLYCVKLFLN